MMTVSVAASNASAASKQKADFVCTGVDDQVIFRRASTAAGVSGTIWLSEGIYHCRIDATHTFTHYGIVRGLGRDATYIRVAGGLSSNTFFQVQGETMVRDLTITPDIGGTPARMVNLSSSWAGIDHCEIVNFDGTAVRVQVGSSTISNSKIWGEKAIDLEAGSNMRILFCDIEGITHGIDGFGFGGSVDVIGCFIEGEIGVLATSPQLRVIGCQIIGTDEIVGAGVQVESAEGAVILGNYIITTGVGVLFDAVTRSWVADNYIGGCGFHAVKIEGGGTQLHIRNNTIVSPGEHGVYITGLVGPDATWIVDNSIVQAGQVTTGGSGIVADTTNTSLRLYIVGNEIELPDMDGIRLGNYGDCQIVGNSLLAYAGSGIILTGDSDRNYIFGNQLRSTAAPTYGIRIDAATCNLNAVLGNDLRGAGGTVYSDAGTGTVNTWPTGAAGTNLV